MRLFLLTVGVICVLTSGCQVIPTDFFPKVKWYWSDESKQYRADRDAGHPQKHQ